MKQLEVKSFSSPSEVKKFEKGKVELIKISNAAIGKMIYEPGWKWSKHVKPIVKTELCMATHYMYMISGTLRVRFPDGTETDIKPGSVALIHPGHDAWVVGDEPAVGIDFEGVLEKK